MIQGRFPNPSGPGTVWAAPERDVAQAFPGYMSVALKTARDSLRTALAIPAMAEPVKTALEEAMDSVRGRPEAERLEDYARRLVEYLKLISDPATASSYDAAKAAGILNHPSEPLVAKWVLRVLLGAYFSGVRAARHPGEPTPPLPTVESLLGTG